MTWGGTLVKRQPESAVGKPDNFKSFAGCCEGGGAAQPALWLVTALHPNVDAPAPASRHCQDLDSLRDIIRDATT